MPAVRRLISAALLGFGLLAWLEWRREQRDVLLVEILSAVQRRPVACGDCGRVHTGVCRPAVDRVIEGAVYGATTPRLPPTVYPWTGNQYG